MPTHALILACRAYAVVVAAIGLMHAAGPERLAWGALALFVPQAIWTIPGLLLLPLTLLRAPRSRVVYVTSQPILPRLVDYWFGLVPELDTPEVGVRTAILAFTVAP